MSFTPFFIIGLPILIFAAMGLIGSTRRSGFWPTLILSVLITPVGGFVVAWLSGPRRPRAPAPPP